MTQGLASMKATDLCELKSSLPWFSQGYHLEAMLLWWEIFIFFKALGSSFLFQSM